MTGLDAQQSGKVLDGRRRRAPGARACPSNSDLACAVRGGFPGLRAPGGPPSTNPVSTTHPALPRRHRSHQRVVHGRPFSPALRPTGRVSVDGPRAAAGVGLAVPPAAPESLPCALLTPYHHGSRGPTAAARLLRPARRVGAVEEPAGGLHQHARAADAARGLRVVTALAAVPVGARREMPRPAAHPADARCRHRRGCNSGMARPPAPARARPRAGARWPIAAGPRSRGSPRVTGEVPRSGSDTTIRAA